ncbi:hypothetical protein ACU686_37435 [Yinghuangia aomiensis]
MPAPVHNPDARTRQRRAQLHGRSPETRTFTRRRTREHRYPHRAHPPTRRQHTPRHNTPPTQHTGDTAHRRQKHRNSRFRAAHTADDTHRSPCIVPTPGQTPRPGAQHPNHHHPTRP